jgi:hypothetical protein
MQIPTGILVDRYGARALLTIGATVAAIGTAVFAMALDLFWANTGRLLIGGSVGAAFVAMLKLASHWMPPSKFALTSGVAMTVGVLGAVSAGAPLRLLVNEFGWRNVMWACAALTVLIAIVTWLRRTTEWHCVDVCALLGHCQRSRNDRDIDGTSGECLQASATAEARQHVDKGGAVDLAAKALTHHAHQCKTGAGAANADGTRRMRKRRKQCRMKQSTQKNETVNRKIFLLQIRMIRIIINAC